ncbi:MAG: glycosyltransferase [Proteobacteria bacterium]|nr:glycosyltransferase [Pseudomonadota bacterium]
MWLIPAVTAIFLLCVSFFFFPLIFLFFIPQSRKRNASLSLPLSVDVLLPCRNEEVTLALTLRSVFEARAEMLSLFPDVRLQVICGLDDCTDTTEAVAKNLGAQVHHFKHRSKWKVIADLIEQSSADWIALADCGAVWDRRFLRNVVPFMASADVSGFAPSYSADGAGLFGRIHWALESMLKSLENVAGGPVSVHGATVLYRSDVLKDALHILAGRVWINDDVTLPLIIRALNPEMRMIYSRNRKMGFVVCDRASRKPSQENNSRRRVSQGNIQWVFFLLPFVRQLNSIVFGLAQRRVVRLFWGVVPVSCAVSAGLFAFQYFPAGTPVRTFAAALSAAGVLAAALKIKGFESSLAALAAAVLRSPEKVEDIRWN